MCMLIFGNVQGILKIMKIRTRMPKPKDIGIIFDVTLKNLDYEYKELLLFRIRANGFCWLNVTPGVVEGKMGRIIGGDFGFIEPGAFQQISLILPTVSLFNRVGICPIIITSTNVNNEKRIIKQLIKFDTRIDILDPGNRTLRKRKDFVDCQNYDKEYFKNCAPVDCEERYFGLRNFYNKTSERCEELSQFSEKFQHKPNNPREIPKDFFQRSHSYQMEQATKENWLYESKNENKRSILLFGLGKALLIVFATIAIYLLICFSIFLFVIWLSRRSSRAENASVHGMVLTPDHLGLLDENIALYTSCSLMSHR